MGFEINKLVAAILVTILIVFGIGEISNIIFKVNKTGVVGYKVEEPARSSSEAKAESSVEISSLLSLGDITHGEKVFKKCAACHSINKDGRNKIGPKLYNVVGRATGTVPGYKYSKALKSYNKTWTFEELNSFLLKPAAWIKGNKMGFTGLKNDMDRASVILYLNQNSDNPQPLP